jgi:hypothetical protein
MKAILEFDLPTERFEHRVAICAPEIYSALTDLDERLRRIAKHGMSEIGPKTIEEFADHLRITHTIPAMNIIQE